MKKPYDKEDEAKTIFVGNLPVNTKKSQIKSHFASFGAIKTIRLRTQAGKKFFKSSDVKNDPCITAYVVFEKPESAISAQERCGKVFRKTHIRVTMATGKKGFYDGKRTIFVGNLKYAVTDDDLFEVFSSCGDIQYVRTIRNKQGCIGTGYVCFHRPDALSLALELNGTMVRDRPVRVERYKAKLKQNKSEMPEEKQPKEVVKFFNGKAVKVKVQPENNVKEKKDKKSKSNPRFQNQQNAVKRLGKGPGSSRFKPRNNSDNKSNKPRSIGQKIQGRSDQRYGGNKKKPNPNKPKITQNMKLAKKLNPNLKKTKPFNKNISK